MPTVGFKERGHRQREPIAEGRRREWVAVAFCRVRHAGGVKMTKVELALRRCRGDDDGAGAR
jgi:hypothetical protein